ncbi:Rne/Rng family ribonuclease [Parapedomonas caeni]
MLIDARHPEETRVAVVRGTRIEDFDFEAASKKQLKGNIYLAKVTRVEPSLQAAFVEYGGNRHGFLAFSEIHPDYYQIPHEDREALLREEEEASTVPDEDVSDAKAEAANGEGTEADDDDHEDEAEEALRRHRMALRRRYKIQEVIKRRQILLVQVVKEERGGKGAALTTYLSLAGRYCVLMPNTTHGGGISRKISSQTDRRRLKSIMSDLKLPAGMGCIIRTAGLKRTKTEIKRDFDYLTRLWDEIREQTLSSVAPCLVYEDSSLIKRAIRDIYSRDVDEIWIEGETGYRAAKDFMRLLMPSHAKKVHLYRDRVPLFHRHQVEAQLESMYRPTVQLRSGGYIVINPTEALVSIDINSGRATKEHNIEETAYKTNLEAADEIARQLRLRDMAGLVVIDFIDMEDKGNVRNVERRLKDALKNDRARIQVGRISNFGLLEMSRQRLRTGVLEASTHVCEHCNGTGFLRTVPSSALHVLRALEDEAIKARASYLQLKVPEPVAIYILNRKRAELIDIEMRYGITVEVEPKGDLIVPQYEIERSGPPPAPVAFEPLKPLPAELEADEADLAIPDEEIEDEVEGEIEAEAEEAAPRQRETRGDGDERGRRRRRRRRRRRPGDRDDTAGAEADAAAGEDAEDTGSTGESTTEAGIEAGAGDAETSAETERRRRRRRRSRRPGDREAATEGGETAPEGDTTDATTEAQAGPAAEVTPAPEAPVEAPAATEAETPAAVEAAPVAEAVEEKPAKPARRKRVTKKAAAEAAAAEAAAAEAAAAPVEAAVGPVAVEAAATEAPPTEATATEAAAPEPAPAEATADGATEEEAGEPRPARRGWWQRTFGD